MTDETSFEATSLDGTHIAVFEKGDGPPLVLVHGAVSDHLNDAPFRDELAIRFATFGMDRRGRGASGDSRDYSIEREFEDVAAVIEAVADRARRRVAVWGHSYGADCAMGAATLTAAIDRLVLYEPGLGMSHPPGSVETVEAALEAGDREQAVVALLSRVVEMTDEEVALIRSLPTWRARVEMVPTAPREMRAETEWVYRPAQFARVTAPTLILAGSESSASQSQATGRAAAAIAGAEIRILEGHGHIAHRTDPAMVAAIVAAFCGTPVLP